MTVAELIELLKTQPQDACIFTESYDLDGDYVSDIGIHLENDSLFIVPSENTLSPESKLN